MIVHRKSPIAVVIVRLFRAFQWVLIAQILPLGILGVLPRSCSERPLIFLMLAYQPAFALYRGLIPKGVLFLGNIPAALAGIIFAAMLYSVLGAILFEAVRGVRRHLRAGE